jgi:tRNA A-37 threonylcarbamoyl transferase component Bud32
VTERPRCKGCGSEVDAASRFCSQCGIDVTDSGEPAATLVMATRTPGGTPSPPVRSTTRQLLRDATSGEYEVHEELGRGGMATVFRAREIALDRNVAIKVLDRHVLRGEDMADRFKLEARTVAKLHHPNIVPIHAVRESESALFFVMKYIDGRSLDAVLASRGPLPVAWVRTVLAGVGGALAYAHRLGVIHRDVKPSNVMIDADGEPVVADFGIAKVAASTGLTVTGATIGTPAYMSPEQCAGGEITGASDQYSLGVVAFEMLAGRLPFEADSAVRLMYMHCHEPAPSLTDFRPDCPPDLASAISRMLAKDPLQRWPSLDAAVTSLAGPQVGALSRSDVGTHVERSAAAGAPRSLHEDESGDHPGRALRFGARGGVTAWAGVALAIGALATLRLWSEWTGGDAVGDPEWVDARPAAPNMDPTNPTADPTTQGADPGLPPVGDASGAGASGGVLEIGRAGTETPGVRVSEVHLEATSRVLRPGGQATWGASAFDEGGMVIPRTTVDNCAPQGWSECGFQWSSSDEDVATVSNGVVTARRPGTADISVSAGGRRATRSLTVQAARAGRVTLSSEEVELNEGERSVLTAWALDAEGNELPDAEFTWSSSAPEIVSVSVTGEVRAGAVGRATVTVEHAGARATARIDVFADPRAVLEDLVSRYAVVMSRGDREGATRLYPAIPDEAARAIQRLRDLRNLEVRLNPSSVDVLGPEASATVSGSYSFLLRSGERQVVEVRFVVAFERTDSGEWVIASWTAAG